MVAPAVEPFCEAYGHHVITPIVGREAVEIVSLGWHLLNAFAPIQAAVDPPRVAAGGLALGSQWRSTALCVSLDRSRQRAAA